jgi:DNA-binding SARP family transcriptional activator/tetratricopeptide (TPR) repeat protein
MSRTGPVTILAADLLGCDELLRRWHDDAAAHGGRKLEDGADELAIVFPDVPAALSCAKQLQRGDGDEPGHEPRVRIGIDIGAEHELTASPKVVATGLCTRAERGQVLVSHAAHGLAVGRPGYEFREVGALELDGLGDPIRAWELLWRELEPRTRIRLCGPLELVIDGNDLVAGVRGGQTGSLLRYLIANRERGADRDELTDVLWPERPPKDPRADLRVILSRLRRELAPATLEGGERIRLTLPDPVWVDVEEATRAIQTARAAAKSGLWESTREQCEAALELLEAGFLPDHDAEWVHVHRRELEELELEALEWTARSSLELGGPDLRAVESVSRALIARAPYRETGYRFLMEALAASGNVAEALRVYDGLRVFLRDELGAAPAAEVQELHKRLLAGDGALPALGPEPRAPESPRRAPLPSLLSPRERSAFVGREQELRVLRKLWEDARSGGRRLVLVVGEPGIGKTRLTSEFALEAHEHGTVLYAGCQEEALLSYQPIVEALRHYARSTGLDWTTVALGPGTRELARLIPDLAAALPAEGTRQPSDPETRRYLLFEAVSFFLSEVSAHTPLMLVLDDLHWADRSTVHLLRHLIRTTHEARLLIAGTYREAEVGADHPLTELLADLRRDRLLERLSLEGLDESDVGALISSHAGHEASSGLVETVHEQTEGNPFFVEEVMRHLIETGVLSARGGRWVSARTLDEIGVPVGVKEVLATRLGRLSDECRVVLTYAAVLGPEFSFDVLGSMVNVDDDALIAALEEALDAQLIVESEDRSRPAYAFTHALVRETLYGNLSGPRRQRLHARAALAIEQAVGDGEIASLAVHHRLAGSAGDAAKAIEYSLRAGSDARELSAWEEAAAHWDGALAVMTRIGAPEAERAKALVALADLMVVVGDLGRQIAYLEQALALYEKLGAEEHAAQVHSRLGMAYSLIDSIYAEHLDIPSAFRHFEEARRVLGHGPPRRGRGHLETGVATALTYGLRIEEGIEAASRAMEIAEQLGDDVLWAGGAEAYSWHKIVAGELDEGFGTLSRAFAVADREQRPFLAWMALNIRGNLTWGLGAPDEAQEFFERPGRLPYVGKTAYRQEIADGVGRCHASRGELAEARRLLSDARPAWITHSLKPLVDQWEGSWERVESLAERVLETSRRTGNRWDEWAAHNLAARVQYLRGEFEPAGERLERALSLVLDGGARYFEMWVRPDLARVRAETGRLDEARMHVEGCRAIIGGGEDWRGIAGRAALAEAVVLALEDRMDEAHVVFGDACEMLRQFHLRGDEADALHQWGRALARAGEDSAAAEMLDHALEIYRAHDAGVAWLARVDADRQRL